MQDNGLVAEVIEKTTVLLDKMEKVMLTPASVVSVARLQEVGKDLLSLKTLIGAVEFPKDLKNRLDKTITYYIVWLANMKEF